MSTRLQNIQYDDQQTLLSFGPLENDPTYDVVAVVNEKNAKLYKQPIKPSAAIHQQTTDNLLKWLIPLFAPDDERCYAKSALEKRIDVL